MKNFKKCIFLGVIILLLIIGMVIYSNHNDNYNEITSEDVYLNVKANNAIEESIVIVHITGEVNNPGIVKIAQNSRLVDVIEAAGGLTGDADINKINLAYIISDGQKIYIPNINENIENYINNEPGEGIIDDTNLGNNTLVNINTATQTELETLTGIGPSIALKIINYRKENGKFKNIEDIKNVPGIGDSKYESIKNNICV